MELDLQVQHQMEVYILILEKLEIVEWKEHNKDSHQVEEDNHNSHKKA